MMFGPISPDAVTQTINLPDLINGTFEAGGALVNLLNVQAILRDKVVKGINPYVYVWFSSWGIFNLYYYPHLNQWLSFYGGAAIVTVNLSWLAIAGYFKFDEHRRRKEAPQRTPFSYTVGTCKGS